jgi:hypothetical protein
MKTLIPILIGLLVVGCGKKESPNTTKGNNTPEKPAKEKIVKETSSKDDDKNSTTGKSTASKNDGKITYDSVSDEEAITGADRLARVCVKAFAGKNLKMLLQQNPNSLPDEDYKQWAKAVWFANLDRMKKEVSNMLKDFEDPDSEMKAFLVKLQADPDKIFDDDLKQQLEMRKLSKDGPRMEIAKKKFIVERNKLALAESDWEKIDVSKVKIVRFKQRNVVKEIPFPNRQVEVTLEVDGREIENTIRMEIVKLPKHGWKYSYLEIHQNRVIQRSRK